MDSSTGYPGRFIQADTIVPNPGRPPDLNRYSYVRNNPVKYIDPSGNCAITDPDTDTCGGRYSDPDITDISPIWIYESDRYDMQRNQSQRLFDWFSAHPWYHPTLDPFLLAGNPAGFAIEANYFWWFTEQVAQGQPTELITANGQGFAVLAGVAVADGGRTYKQARLRELADDPNQPSYVRGWIKQEMNAIQRGARTTIRVPPGFQLAHRRGLEAKQGFSYRFSDLQNIFLHYLQHKYEGR